jgi:dihydroorotate dehydrogenase
MSIAHDLLSPMLRTLDPETAHSLAISALRHGLGPRNRADAHPSLGIDLAGLNLSNPIGLAAGFDKNAETPDAMLAAGFGFVECGTVTPRAQSGNPRPRVFRLTQDEAVINRLGFNNEGLAPFVARLQRRLRKGIVGANVGANKDTSDKAADYVAGLAEVWAYADYVTINISSPNTPGLRGLQEKGALDDLLARIHAAREPLVAVHGRRPVFLKVAPDIDDSAVGDIATLAQRYALDGLIVSNTTITRPDTLISASRTETGGLSGKPLFDPSTRVLRQFYAAIGPRMPLIGVGGVSDGKSALAKIKAGARAVQLYTALIYRGPGLAKKIADDLALRLKAEGFANVKDAVGVG